MEKRKEASGMLMIGIILIMLLDYLSESVVYPIYVEILGLVTLLLCFINFGIGSKLFLNISLSLSLILSILVMLITI